jgi:hypothetical protein
MKGIVLAGGSGNPPLPDYYSYQQAVDAYL